MRKAAAERTPVANGAIGDAACDEGQGAEREIGDAPILDVAVRDTGADRELRAAIF